MPVSDTRFMYCMQRLVFCCLFNRVTIQAWDYTCILQAALIAITSAAEVLSTTIEGEEGAEGPVDAAAAQATAQTLLQLLLHLSVVKDSSGCARLQLLKLDLMQSLAPALMRHLATTGADSQVCFAC